MARNDKVSHKTKRKIIKELITKENINPLVFDEIRRFELSHMFGWLPSQIDNEKVEDLKIYGAIMAGKNSLMDREIKRALNG